MLMHGGLSFKLLSYVSPCKYTKYTWGTLKGLLPGLWRDGIDGECLFTDAVWTHTVTQGTVHCKHSVFMCSSGRLRAECVYVTGHTCSLLLAFLPNSPRMLYLHLHYPTLCQNQINKKTNISFPSCVLWKSPRIIEYTLTVNLKCRTKKAKLLFLNYAM